MASRQLHKVKPTETLVSTRTQSLELVQTLVHGSVSRILWLRKLFSERHFDNREYYIDDSPPSYSDYTSGQPSNSSSSRKPKLALKVLKRNSRGEADICLDWLEKGAFQVLKENFLHELELRVVEDENAAEEFIEAYTFTFSYLGTVGEDKRVAVNQVKAPNNTQVTITNAKAGLKASVESLNAICGPLPPLPGKRYLEMVLTMTEDCPKDYKLDGFVDVSGRKVVFSRKLSELQYTPRIEYQGGFHNAQIIISHARSQSSTRNITQRPMSVDPAYSITRAKDADKVTKPLSTGLSLNNTNGGSRLQGSVTTNQEMSYASDYLLTQNINQFHAREITDRFEDLDVEDSSGQMIGQESRRKGTTSSRLVTEESQMVMHAKHIQKLARVPQVNAGLDDTQLRYVDSPPRTQTARIQTQTNALGTAVASSIELADRQFDTAQASPAVQENQEMFYSQAVIDRLKKNLFQDVSPGKSVIRCICNWAELERDSINCDKCKKWQHVICHGYRNRADKRIPHEHFCYHCLINDDESSLLTDLHDVALMRKAIDAFGEDGKGWIKPLQFAKKLGLGDDGSQIATKIRNRLIDEKVLVAVPSKQKGKRFVIATSGPGLEKLELEYRNPAHKIRHLLQDPDESVDEDSVLDRIMADSNNPPPQALPGTLQSQLNEVALSQALQPRQSRINTTASVDQNQSTLGHAQLQRAATPHVPRPGLRPRKTVVPESPQTNVSGSANQVMATPAANTRKRLFNEIEASSTASGTSVPSPSTGSTVNGRRRKRTGWLLDLELTPKV